jgi:chromosome segregation ATPase
MKNLTYSLLALAALLVFSPQSIHAQTQKSPDQVMNELLNEVRKLGQDLRKMTANTYRTQTVFEKLRLDQDQLSRASIEQGRVRVQVAAIRASRVELTEKFKDLDRKFQIGAIADTELTAIKAQLAELDPREAELLTRDSQLTAEINLAQARVEELNKRLDALERELATIGNEKP